jgi:transposase
MVVFAVDIGRRMMEPSRTSLQCGRRTLLSQQCNSINGAGALAVIRYAKIHGTGHRPWLTGLLARRPTKVAAIALANKLARMAWAMMTRNEDYKEPVALMA